MDYREHTEELLAILVRGIATRDNELLWGAAHALSIGGDKSAASALYDIWRVLSPLFPDLNADSMRGWCWQVVGVAMISLMDQSDCEALVATGDPYQRSLAEFRLFRGDEMQRFWTMGPGL